MALVLVGAFTTGFAAGWLARSFTRTTRGALVGLVATAQHARHSLTRIVGHTMEWAEDLMAEGKAHYESTRARPEHKPPPANAPLEGP
jgi:hypothetical protein